MLSFIPSLQKATWHTKMHWHKKNIDTTEKNTILKRYTHTHTQHARESQPWQADIKQLDLCYVPNTDPTGQNTCLCLFVCLSSWTLYVCDGGRKWNKANSVTFARHCKIFDDYLGWAVRLTLYFLKSRKAFLPRKPGALLDYSAIEAGKA